jgi:small conductance mechanosensitive channel
MKIRHMTSDELFVEADGWLELLKKAAAKAYEAKIALTQKNEQIEALKKRDTNATEAGERAQIQEEIEALTKERDAIIEKLNRLRVEKEKMSNRLDTVLKNIDEKVGMGENGKESDKVLQYRRYIDTVSGISLEMNDMESGWKTIIGWAMSKEGGIRWLINFAKFVAILLIAMLISKLLGGGVRKALEHTPRNSQLLTEFIVNIVKKLVMLVGLLIGLAALDIDIAPILAMVGAAGFVVAFALQGTLSNFASGLMIMLYRPYDIGDVVEVAGIIGTVKSMTLVSTSIVTADNRMMVVPNNSIWGNIITNVTHSPTRRVDMTFGIGYDDDIEKAQKVMAKILDEHPLVLKDPAPTIQVHELADSSVNFVCRPWVKTADYWTVLWEVTRTVKERFDAEGISIPYPQQDIHLIEPEANESDVSQKKGKEKRYTKKGKKKIDPKEMDKEEEA